MLTAVLAPFNKDHDRHGTERLQGVLAKSGQQFLVADMMNHVLFRFAEHFVGVIKGLTKKQIGIAMVSRISFQNSLQTFFEIHGLHATFNALPRARPAPVDASGANISRRGRSKTAAPLLPAASIALGLSSFRR